MHHPDNKNLAERFHEYFSIELATSQEQIDRIFKIRYRVYCDEFKFLPAESHPDQLESDEYDDYAYQCLITHKSSNMPAACVRVIPAVSPSGVVPLPYEKLGPNILDKEFFNNFDVPPDSLCEISRLAVDGAFRRRSGEATTRFGEIDALDITQVEKRTFGLIAVASFMASAVLADLNKQANGFAMMEPFLPRLMQRSGIHFERAGLDVNYHGLRAPYFIKMESFLETMNPDIRSFYDAIHNSIAPS